MLFFVINNNNSRFFQNESEDNSGVEEHIYLILNSRRFGCLCSHFQEIQQAQVTKRRKLTQPQPREMLRPGAREKRRETERHFDGDREKEIDRHAHTHTGW